MGGKKTKKFVVMIFINKCLESILIRIVKVKLNYVLNNIMFEFLISFKFYWKGI